MKRRLMGIALLAAAMGLTAPEAFGFGGRKKNDCGTTAGCGTPCTSYTVSYVEKKVMVTEWEAAKEEYKYWANEPEKKKEKIKVKEMKTKEEPYKYWVNEWVTVKEKVKVGEWKTKTEEKEVTVVEWKPKTTKQKKTVCEWVCVPVTVTCAAPAPRSGLFGGLCCKKKDCADPCATPCPPVVTKTVMQRQMATKEVEVDVVSYDKIETKVKKPVTTKELVWIDKEVEVKKCQPVEKEGKKTVCFWVDVEKEVEVTTWKKVEKTGMKDVMKPKQVEKTVKVAVYTAVPAPAPAPCPTPCAAPCGTTGGCGSARGGLFKGGLFKGKGGCCN